MCGRIALLGDVTCAGPAGSVDQRRLAARRTRVALARLVLARGEPVSRDALAEALWPHDLPATWNAALRTVIADVRSILDDAGWTRAALSGTAGMLRLDLGETAVDVVDAERAMLAASAALRRDDAASAVDHARSAAEILRRPFLPDVEGGWVDDQRRAVERSFVAALEVLGAAAMAIGDHGSAVDAATEAVLVDPQSERAYRALARAHLAAGDRRAALETYERCRTMLAEELGVDPSPATEALHLELLGGATAARRLPSGLRTASRFRLVGRTAERAAVVGAWQRAVVGDGGVVVVRGEAGSGKSRLVADVATDVHREGSTVLYGRCLEHGPPMAPLIEAGAPAAGGERAEWLDRLQGWLTEVAAAGPVLLVVDDVHLAGPGLVVALRHLVRAAVDRAICIVLTCRTVPGHRPPPAAALNAELRRDDLVDEVDLPNLSPADVAELVGQLADHPLDGEVTSWTVDLARHTGGNALFVTESLRWLWDTGDIACDDAGRWTATADAVAVGPEVAAIVAGRVAGLPTGAAEALAAAAVAGEWFDLRAVAHGTGSHLSEVVTAMEAALIAGLLVDDPHDGRRWRFAHAIIREAILGAVPLARRMELHGRIGIAIEQDRSLGSIADAARHLVAAAPLGDIGRAVSYAVTAAQEATSSHAAEDAVELLDHALRLPVTESVRAALLVQRGFALRNCGRNADALAAFDDAIDVARRCGAGDTLAEAAIGATRGGADRSEWVGDDDGRRLLDEALGAVEGDVLRIRVLGELALRVQDGTRRQALAAEAIRLAQNEATTEALVAGYPAALVAHWSPSDTGTRLAYSAQLIERPGVDAHTLAVIGLDRLADLLRSGDRPTFEAERLRLAEEIEALGERRRRWAMGTFDYLVATMAGHWSGAETIADQIMAVWQGSPDVDALTAHAGQRGWARTLAGDPSDLVAVARAGMAAFPEVRIYRCALALALARAGDVAAVRATLRPIAAEGWAGLPRDSGYGAAVVAAAEAVAVVADREPATSLLELALPFADHIAVLSGPGLFLGPVALALAPLAQLTGRPGLAAELLDLAAERAARVGAPPWEARARRSLAAR